MSKNKKQDNAPTAAVGKEITLEERYRQEAYAFPGSAGQRQVLLKKIFWILALVMLPLLMFLSKDYGITGDERDMHMYAQDEIHFYTSFGKDTAATAQTYFFANDKEKKKETHMFVYGGLFDLCAESLNHLFHPADPYRIRHMLNAACGWAAMLFAGLLAALFMGWEAALIAFLLLLFSPGFFGQMMNNPKDIPFAAGYIAALYGIVRFILLSPQTRRSHALVAGFAIAAALNIRVAGLLLLIYAVLFYGIYRFSYERFAVFGKMFKPRSAKMLLLLLAVGYFGGVLFWPYGLVNPFTHPLDTLQKLEKFPVKIKVLFDGQAIMSSSLPWYYLLKWIWISVPLSVLLGSLAYFGAAWFMKLTPARRLLLLVPAFGAAFPLFYAIYKKSNVYDGWRHFLFVYPCLVVMAALVWTWLVKYQRTKALSWVALAGLVGYTLLTGAWMVRNHPNETVYFNELEGGVRQAYGNYETDYYMNSIKPCADWLKKNVLDKTKDKIIIGTNTINPVQEYLAAYPNTITGYITQQNMSSKNWDYAILFSRFFDRPSVLNKLWMPKEVVYTVTADGVPLACVVKRGNRDDYYASEALKKNQVDTAIQLYHQSLAYDNRNQGALLGLANAYLMKQDLEAAQKTLDDLLKLDPDNNDGLTLLLRIQLATGKTDAARLTAQQFIALAPDDPSTYGILAQTYHEMHDDQSASYYQQIAMQKDQEQNPPGEK